jgi:hypothetical protein
MKKVLVILIALMLSISFCKKEDDLIVTCQGDCHNYSFKIGNESGPITASMTVTYVYNSSGALASAHASGTLTYENSGNTYQVNQNVDYQTCKYTVEVSFEGKKTSCGN